ncbi:alpha/beta hydrolase [Microterricola pindariensis]|uniref:Alpha/beta hydrolase n=1 Tax=Microterricola pindariensis TaxID=478010 RepID=A0ABX5AX89_9MICO|nr:alpha/beta hydrolase [Microterricola pindariensis]PPL19442.1 alpha/beta hydrolase [Microterricola pindariensis]
MPLHPEIARFLASLPHEEPAPLDPAPLDPAAMRAGEESQVPALPDRHPVAHVTDIVVQAPTGAVPVRVYSDTDAPTSGAIVYFHGGAYFLGSLNTHDDVARRLATATGLRVFSVGYRLAPEHPFPAALDDAVGVIDWLISEGESAGWDGTTLAVVGDSSGGTIATVAASLLHDRGVDRITHQVLYYPSVDLDLDPNRYPSMVENAVGFGLETAGIAPFNAFYFTSGADPLDPRVSPIGRPNLSGLPAALILTAELDPMRDEGEQYGQRLTDAGVPTVVHRYEGAGHGFVQHFAWLPEYGAAFAETAAFLETGTAPTLPKGLQ